MKSSKGKLELHGDNSLLLPHMVLASNSTIYPSDTNPELHWVPIGKTQCSGIPPTHNIVQLPLTTWHTVKTMESYHQLRNPKACLWRFGTLNLYYPTTQAMLTPRHQGVLWFFPDAATGFHRDNQGSWYGKPHRHIRRQNCLVFNTYTSLNYPQTTS